MLTQISGLLSLLNEGLCSMPHYNHTNTASVVLQPIFIVMFFVPVQYGTLLSICHSVRSEEPCYNCLPVFIEGTKQSAMLCYKQKITPIKMAWSILKHNVILCVRYAQPCLRSFHAGQWLSHKHTMLSSRHHSHHL